MGLETCKACWDTTPPPPWTEFLTHASENITWPQLRYRSQIYIIYYRWTLNFTNSPSLPPANEVWGKVMFLDLSVILSKREGGFPACITSHITGGSAFKGRGALHLGAGVYIQEVEKRAARILLECFLVFDCPQLNQQIV